LRGDSEAVKPSGEKILERLSMPTATSTPTHKLEEQSEEKVDQSKLAALAKPVEPAPATPATKQPEKPQELEKANEKLAGLVKPK
jgi:hypothetical protein